MKYPDKTITCQHCRNEFNYQDNFRYCPCCKSEFAAEQVNGARQRVKQDEYLSNVVGYCVMGGMLIMSLPVFLSLWIESSIISIALFGSGLATMLLPGLYSKPFEEMARKKYPEY